MHKDMEWLIFGTVGLFLENFFGLFFQGPALIIMTAQTNYDAFG